MAVSTQPQNAAPGGLGAPVSGGLPCGLLYATSARIGAKGLGTTALETLLAPLRDGCLGMAVAYGNRSHTIPRAKVCSLHLHPVRALSWINRRFYHAIKRDMLDQTAAAMLRSGSYDCFHGWSGEAIHSLQTARFLGIPALLEIPTWHRDKGKRKPFLTAEERERLQARNNLHPFARYETTRQQVLAEYALADLLLVQSAKARETFLDVGFPTEKLHYVARGVDPGRFQVGEPPCLFRLAFVGSLIKRKGVHHLLEAWHRLKLQRAELLLIGNAEPEIEPYLDRFTDSTVVRRGFVEDVPSELARCSAFVFPSECEGSAKATFEAAACGLPMIATREAGDAVVDGLNGRIVPPGNTEALVAAIREFHSEPQRIRQMGLAGRERVEREFTWEHFRQRLREGYRLAAARRAGGSV